MKKKKDERMQVVEIIRCAPYMKVSDVMEEFGICRNTVYKRIEGIEQEKERYGDTAVIRDEKLIMVNLYAFVDFLKWRDRLSQKNTRKFVPEYDPAKWAEAMGACKKVYVEEMAI